jgi:glycosyltransferase involved in cell wall biosynthesis
MRIVHLSTGHLGGAGLAARRLSNGLHDAGVDSTFLALENPTFIPGKHESQISRGIGQRIQAGASTLVSGRCTDKSLVTPLSTNVIDRNLLQKLSANKRTIFHVHNWFNLFSQRNLTELSREFNFVLTLHDQRIFTGACHYSLGCEKFKSECNKCPQLPILFDSFPVRSNQNKTFSNLDFITPSKWLLKLANSSKVLCDSKGEVIPNSFFGYEATVIKNSSASTKIRIGFAAMDSNSWVKGGDLVSALMKKYAGDDKYEFLTLTSFTNYKDFWTSIDLLLVPSRADNSPNVIHEAKLWGIPVISSNVGGIPEVLHKDFDKCIPIETLSLEAIESVIDQVYKSSLNFDLRSEISASHLKFLDSSINRHLKFYENMLRKNCLNGRK